MTQEEDFQPLEQLMLILFGSFIFFFFPGDEILGASINFEHLSKEEVLQVLKVMEPFNDKVHVFTRNNRSKSLGHLDQCVGPETVGGAGSDQTLELLPPSLTPLPVFRC